jgi:hypothetical protein
MPLGYSIKLIANQQWTEEAHNKEGFAEDEWPCAAALVEPSHFNRAASGDV